MGFRKYGMEVSCLVMIVVEITCPRNGANRFHSSPHAHTAYAYTCSNVTPIVRLLLPKLILRTSSRLTAHNSTFTGARSLMSKLSGGRLITRAYLSMSTLSVSIV